MKTVAVLGVVMALSCIGCASADMTKDGAERDFSGIARRGNPSLRVGEAHVVDAGIHPALPLRTGQAARVQLEGGRFIVCWTRGSVEQGRRALAQAYKADGSPLGAPVVISPHDVDVVESPKVMTTDGRHVVVTFAAASANSMDYLTVPIDAQGSGASAERTAQR